MSDFEQRARIIADELRARLIADAEALATKQKMSGGIRANWRAHVAELAALYRAEPMPPEVRKT